MTMCVDNQMFKIVNANPNSRYIPLDRSAEHMQEILDDLLDLGKWHNAHYNETIHIVGCGPSARKFEDYAAGRISIGVNGAGSFIPDLMYWLACDPILNDRPLNQAIREYHATNPNLKHKFQFALSWGLNPMKEPLHNWTLFKQTHEILPWHDKPCWRNGLFSHHCSVHAAMGLARVMGAKKIWLWGVDYTDRSHAYTDKEIIGDEKDNPGKPWDDFQFHLAGFKKIKEVFDKEGIEVYNANTESLLGIFPRIPYISDPTDTRHWKINWRMFCTNEYKDLAIENAWKFAKYNLGVKWDMMDSQKDWMKNCLQRPALLKKVMEAQKYYAVGLLDADVEPVKDPEWFYKAAPNWDVMVRHRGDDKPDWDRYCAGYVAFACTPRGKKTLDEWVQICEKDPEPDKFCREQAYLCQAIEKTQPRLLKLPDEYDFVPPKKWDNKIPEKTVLLHLPASRALLKVIGGTRGKNK